MRFIHELSDWPKLTWDDTRLSPLLAEIRFCQGRFLGKLSNLGFRFREEATLSALTSEVVKSSAIEGERLNTDEVRSSIARRLGMTFDSSVVPGRNVEGVVEMMLDATQGAFEPLTSERLFAWHASLFPTGRSGMHPIVVGRWRTPESGPMQVVSGPLGREKVHFEAPMADRLEDEMKLFLEWFEATDGVDLVLKAGVAHFWFVTIHPFEDGNGRIARAIADLALARAEKSIERFYSLSSQIEAERNQYYRSLELAQRGGLNVTQWLEWFLGCLGRALTKADAELAKILKKAKIWERINRTAVNERQRNVINRLLDGFEGNLSSSKYAKLAKCSADTALRDLKELIASGIMIQTNAGGRSTRYHLSESVTD